MSNILLRKFLDLYKPESSTSYDHCLSLKNDDKTNQINFADF